MLRRHSALNRSLRRWAVAAGRSLPPHTRAAARSLRNRVRLSRRPTHLGESLPAVDVWAETERLADSLRSALSHGDIDVIRTWRSGPALIVDADQSAEAIRALQASPYADGWWVRRGRRRYLPVARLNPEPAEGVWRIRHANGGGRPPAAGPDVIVQFAGHEDYATQHQPLRSFEHPPVLRMVEPIDVVYTWVDDTDPEWRRQRAGYSPDTEGLALDALSRSRTVDHGELRYSLRSLARYAGWVRHIWVVTSGQVPAWLRLDHPKLTLVTHEQIFTDPSALPTFNSHAIESQLHHIEGLAEHFVYLNDDVFLGRPVAPELFFHGNGIAKFMTSPLTIDLDPPRTPRDGAAWAARNNRDLVERLWGRTITHRMKHVPHAHVRSALIDLERRAPEVIERVARARFRSTTDVSVASDLGHYHTFAMGLAAPGTLSFRYVDVASPALPAYFDDLLTRRSFDVFCINDAQTIDSPGRTRQITDFLQNYFPTPSPYEHPHENSPESQAGRAAGSAAGVAGAAPD